ncbi:MULTISPECIES: NRAMP family divalent metal transporter [Acidithiobacillus]|uniref:Mn(II)/Fe(II) transporter-NRAMP family MntH n=3 Tax=Acidithiobacillus caldus TaxID=33059 RepID=F9ZNE9_ACICS|nr:MULTISPECIES: divalent metal cation transporter [Acidithiobacillus]AEK58192.1 Mn(II)/Fe(II) transporter - NRAMP family MntH [Acidithiobacillus caldus SM-1]AIA55178.1 Manganese transport protein MntH [Acidithiobacillus caldus ATCC 51756]AUW32827.1 divalent metal cation transporter [Acidithiobacillus caldus]MBU2729392.1 divalent metal cation transporter [Acidithiobacillus caldus]MBU2735775.1 divalent metal cation transporter [Acidithiobacillus caldus ATCC 51756]
MLGPGLVVMLADTDVGSIITAAQSGAQWGYRLLLLQFILMPILFIVQELTVRLGIFTGKGHGELIRERFGSGWAYLSVSGLTIATTGALLTEFSGMAGVSELYGLPRAVGIATAAAALLLIVWTGSYRRVERIALILGLFELVFFAIAIVSHPDIHEMGRDILQIPVADSHYMMLVAANIGAVIMPWMVFYQQSAVADKGLRPEQYREARWDTAFGAVITQAVMAAVLVAVAATIALRNPNAPLNTVQQLSEAIVPFLGSAWGYLVFSVGIVGAGMVAAIVASLAGAWGWGEVTGFRHSLEYHPREAPWFYGTYTFIVLAGALAVALVPNLVALDIAVEVMNALLLPLVLGFLVALAIYALPPEHRLRGWYLWLVVAVSILTAGLGVYGGISSIPGL